MSIGLNDVRAAEQQLTQRLWSLADVDYRGAVWVTALCVETVATLRHEDPHIDRFEGQIVEAVTLAKRWATGEDILEKVARDMERQLLGICEEGETSIATRCAATAAGALAGACCGWHDVGRLSMALSYAGCAWGSYQRRASDAHYYQSRLGQLKAFGRILDWETTPMEPAPADVEHAVPTAAVVWDVAAADVRPVQLGGLGAALSRARVGGWDWKCPVERAIAERLPADHPVLVRLGGR